jgi:hypothetical protein
VSLREGGGTWISVRDASNKSFRHDASRASHVDVRMVMCDLLLKPERSRDD